MFPMVKSLLQLFLAPSFVNIPDWFCKNAITTNFSATNGTGGYGFDVAECLFDTTLRKLVFHPQIIGNNINNHQLSGQCVTVATI